MKKTSPISAILIIILMTACASNSVAAPTSVPIDINALKTAAVKTVIANITQTAAANPTLTPTQTLTPAALIPTQTVTSTVTPTLSGSPTVATCDNSVFINDASVPDGTQMTAGQAFVKTWKVKNTGVCSWGTGYQIIYSYGEKLGGLPTALTAEVLPNTEVEISINLKAPDKSGNYSGYWRLATNNGVPFGQVFTVIISVP